GGRPRAGAAAFGGGARWSSRPPTAGARSRRPRIRSWPRDRHSRPQDARSPSSDDEAKPKVQLSEHQPAGTVVRVLTSRTSEKPDKRLPLKQLGAFVASTLVGGLLIVVPIYLAV